MLGPAYKGIVCSRQSGLILIEKNIFFCRILSRIFVSEVMGDGRLEVLLGSNSTARSQMTNNSILNSVMCRCRRDTLQRSNEKTELTKWTQAVWQEIIEWLPIPCFGDQVDAGAIHGDKEYRGIICISVLYVFIFVRVSFLIFKICVLGEGKEGFVEEGDIQASDTCVLTKWLMYLSDRSNQGQRYFSARADKIRGSGTKPFEE